MVTFKKGQTHLQKFFEDKENKKNHYSYHIAFANILVNWLNAVDTRFKFFIRMRTIAVICSLGGKPCRSAACVILERKATAQMPQFTELPRSAKV